MLFCHEVAPWIFWYCSSFTIFHGGFAVCQNAFRPLVCVLLLKGDPWEAKETFQGCHGGFEHRYSMDIVLKIFQKPSQFTIHGQIQTQVHQCYVASYVAFLHVYCSSNYYFWTFAIDIFLFFFCWITWIL